MIDFKKIIGHDKAIENLKNKIKHNRVGQSYLFSGQDGIGKKLTAIAFSKAINCTNLSEDLDPCNKCLSCRKIDRGISADFAIISPENLTIKIDQIRELKDNIYFQPLENKKKIYIIDNAEKMTTEASNSLLKILEDPPEYAIIILITAFPDSILPTILSRCSRVLFRSLNIKKQREILAIIMPDGKEEEIERLLRLTYGNPGKAFFLSTDEQKRKEVKNCIEMLANMKPEEMMDYLIHMDKKFGKIMDSFQNFIELMQLWYRDILFFKIGQDKGKIIFQEHFNEIQSDAEYYSRERLVNILEYLTAIQEKIDMHINPKLLLENILIKLGER